MLINTIQKFTIPENGKLIIMIYLNFQDSFILI